MKSLIIEKAHEIKISQIGFLKAEVFYDLGDVLDEHSDIPMTEPDVQKRINPFLIMKNAKTIIACLCSYYCGDRGGNISKYARGADYHYVMQEKLGVLCSLLRRRGYTAQAFCDNGVLNDRYIAVRAGLGFIGKNGFLINEKYGTYTFIGYIITDCEIEPSGYSVKSCSGCGRCMQACPTGALGADGVDGYRCLSYITQKKGELTDDECALIRRCKSVWGCDICQDVCPHNKGIEYTNIAEFRDGLINFLEIDESMTNREFKEKYARRAFTWRGKAVVLRNLQCLE